MKIGEFARICDTKISVLRYYEKKELLTPDYIDRFTGYRYYAPEQISVFSRITALKSAGFSLAEIRQALAFTQSDQEILCLLEQKKQMLEQSLRNLEQAKQILLGGNIMLSVSYSDSVGRTIASAPNQLSCSFDELCERMENELTAQGYQRISIYSSQNDGICCEVLKLSDKIAELHETIDLPFEPDDAVIGRWRVIGEFAVKEDFLQNRLCNPDYDETPAQEIYFLPNGEKYWCHGWTKGILFLDDGVSTSQNPYTLERQNGKEYLFITFKSYHYRRGGKPTVLVLENIDHNRYSAQELARKDDIDLPFVPDDRMVGSWTAHSYWKDKEDFDPKQHTENLYWSAVTFFPDGSCTSIYRDQTISGSEMQTWTKGFLLRKFNHCACACEIRTIDGIDYLIVEWKSGDYRWGGFDTDYYVFTRNPSSN